MTALLEEEVVEEVQGLSSSDQEDLRRRARTDLYFLSVGVLQYQDVNPGTHGAFCRFIQGNSKLRRLGLMPRGHLKSTIATIADSIRLALADPENCRILLASETATLSEGFLGEIKRHWERNQVLRSLFPELVPKRMSGPGVEWAAHQASVERSSPHGTATWTTVGVGGQVVGKHFNRIKCDDLIGFEALRSQAAMNRAKEWLNYIEPLLINDHEDRIDFIGTRWSRNDLYARVMEIYRERLAVFSRRAIETDNAGNLHIIFPQKMSMQKYRDIQRENPALWYAQYENNPVSLGQSDLDYSAVRRFEILDDGETLKLDNGKVWHIAQLDRVLCADPNSGSLTAPDQAAISIQGISPHDEIIQLDAWGGRVDPTSFVDRIYSMARRWTVRAVGIEKAGQQNTRHYFEQKISGNDWYVRVVDLEPKGRKKEDRIRYNLGPVIRNGRYFIREGHQADLAKQLMEFPDCELWDLLDAAAYGPDILRRPEERTKQAEKDRESLIRKLLARRSSRTGY